MISPPCNASFSHKFAIHTPAINTIEYITFDPNVVLLLSSLLFKLSSLLLIFVKVGGDELLP